MKLVISNNGKKTLKLSKSEWQSIGSSNGWIRSAQVQPNQVQPNQAQPNQAQPNQAQPNQAQPNQSKAPQQINFTYLLPASYDIKKLSLINQDLVRLEEKFNNIYNRFLFKNFPISASELDILKDPTTKSSIDFLLSVINGNNYLKDSTKKELINGLKQLNNFVNVIIQGNGNAAPSIISSINDKRKFVNNVINVSKTQLIKHN